MLRKHPKEFKCLNCHKYYPNKSRPTGKFCGYSCWHEFRKSPEQVNERVGALIEKTLSCWNWTGYLNIDGYGEFALNGKCTKAHRYVYTQLVGAIEKGKVLDHTCRNRRCVNPSHLKPVTPRENALFNSDGVAATNMKKTHCVNGHELSGSNLYIKPTNGARNCRTCRNVASLKSRQKEYSFA